PFHVQQTFTNQPPHGLSVTQLETWGFGSSNFEFRNYRSTNLDSLFRIIGGRFCVHGHTMADSELDTFSIDHIQRIALGFVTVALQNWSPSKRGCVLASANDHLRLEYPSSILILFRLCLVVHKKQGHQPITLSCHVSNDTLDKHFGTRRIDSERLDW